MKNKILTLTAGLLFSATSLFAANHGHAKDIAITVEDGKVKINGATVVKADIMTSNGVIHVIDAVILPPTE